MGLKFSIKIPFCFQDLEVNDGTKAKPYYMPKAMQKIVNKYNQEGTVRKAKVGTKDKDSDAKSESSSGSESERKLDKKKKKKDKEKGKKDDRKKNPKKRRK